MSATPAPRIQPVVIGTAGHIDHGKSSLVRALTGVDPDRLQEERERGLTIDLGFAPLELPDGRLVGIVDVPGHERFIRNMVAGATGIDLVVLVVAADDGVMPQTREHLDIMGLLGVERGFVALNKIDLVDAEMVELAAAEVAEVTAGTFLDGSPIVRVSATTGEGLEALRAELVALAGRSQPRSEGGIFRMPVQRVFSAPGFGTVVTGIPVSGTLELGETIEITPGGLRGKVRGIQAYHRRAERARAGHSTAINLSDVERRQVHRGCVAAHPDYFSSVRMVAARLSLLASLERPLVNRAQVRLHTGTSDCLGEVVLLEHGELPPGETGLVQLRLVEPVVCAPGDRFVLRRASPAATLGGGVILEESRFRLKRFKTFVIDELGTQERSLISPETLLESVLARHGAQLVTSQALALAIKLPLDQTRQLLGALAQKGCIQAPAGPDRWIHVDAMQASVARLRRCVEQWFSEHPHRQVVETLTLRGLTDFEPALLNALLGAEAARGAWTLEAGGRVRPLGRRGEVAPELQALREKVVSCLAAARFQPPRLAQLQGELGCAEEALGRVLELLVDEGLVRHIGKDLYLHADAIEAAREAIVANCERHDHLEIPELRDALGTTRKWLIPLLEYFDAQGLTLRQAGNRVLKRR